MYHLTTPVCPGLAPLLGPGQENSGPPFSRHSVMVRCPPSAGTSELNSNERKLGPLPLSGAKSLHLRIPPQHLLPSALAGCAVTGNAVYLSEP